MATQKKIHVSYAQAVYGKEEIAAVNRVLGTPTKLVPGPEAQKFEKAVARLFGKKEGVFVNSGSSANLLAFESLGLPKGSEVITPVFTFSTTVAPILQKGLVPVFVDVEEGTYLADLDQVERAVTKKTKAIMIPSLLGNIPDLKRIRSFALRHKLFVIEDSCDTIGARFEGRPTGAYTDISTTSFYASHIITAAAGGGIVCFHDKTLARRARVMAAWGRDSTLFGFHEKSENIQKRFAGRIGGDAYDAKFIFSAIGYNFQSTDIAAAFGNVQLSRLGEFSQLRRRRFAELQHFFSRYAQWFVLPRQHAKAVTNWLAFPLTIKTGAPFTRLEITKHLEEQNIQTRPIFTGNVLRQPAFSRIRHRKAVSAFPHADYIMKNGFLLGAHHGMSNTQMQYLLNTLAAFFERHT